MNGFKNAYDSRGQSEHITGTTIRLWAEVLVHHCRFHIADPVTFPYLEACGALFRGFPRGSQVRGTWVEVRLILSLGLIYPLTSFLDGSLPYSSGGCLGIQSLRDPPPTHGMGYAELVRPHGGRPRAAHGIRL